MSTAREEKEFVFMFCTPKKNHVPAIKSITIGDVAVFDVFVYLFVIISHTAQNIDMFLPFLSTHPRDITILISLGNYL